MDEGQQPDNRTKNTYPSSATKFSGTPNLTRGTRVLPSIHPRHVSPIHTISKREQLAFALQLEIGVVA